METKTAALAAVSLLVIPAEAGIQSCVLNEKLDPVSSYVPVLHGMTSS